MVEWVAELRRRGLSPSRIRQSYRLLAQIMRAAVENDMIAVSPCRSVRLPKMSQTEPHILTEADVDQIIAVGPFLTAIDALRIGPQEYIDSVASSLSDLGHRDSGIEPERDRSMAEGVRTVRQRRWHP